MRIKRTFVCFCLLSLSIFFTHAVLAESTLILGVHPYKQATEISKSFTPLVKYLSDKTNRSFKLKISKNYQTHIDLIGNDQVHIAYMGPASYIKLVENYGKKRLLSRLEINGKPTFQGVIITRQDSDISALKLLQNKRFAFGSPSSTMSHLVPRYMLFDAGIPVSALEKYAFLGNHVNVALGVLTGNYDAGAVKEAIYKKYKEKGLKALATTVPLSEHLFIASDNIDNKFVIKLREIMLELNLQSNGPDILKSIKKTTTALVAVRDSDYDNLRKMMETLQHLDPALN